MMKPKIHVLKVNAISRLVFLWKCTELESLKLSLIICFFLGKVSE